MHCVNFVFIPGVESGGKPRVTTIFYGCSQIFRPASNNFPSTQRVIAKVFPLRCAVFKLFRWGIFKLQQWKNFAGCGIKTKISDLFKYLMWCLRKSELGIIKVRPRLVHLNFPLFANCFSHSVLCVGKYLSGTRLENMPQKGASECG